MNLLQQIDAHTARQFVIAARHIIDAMLIEAGRIEAAKPPTRTDYNHAELPRDAPPGGWISPSELRETARRMSEAIATEKWTDGLLAFFQFSRALGL